MAYIYETHLHTCEASACGRTHGRDYIPYMKEKGYAGIIVTDHFFNGNSAVPRDLPWKTRCDLYCAGYEQALEASLNPATANGLKVFFGIEYNFQGDEYLLYGLDKNWLYNNPDILSCSRAEVFERVHQGGGIMIHAHPYRERDYLDTIHLTPSVCDGAETFNAGNEPYMNALGKEFAQKYHFLEAGGSDVHHANNGPLGGMSFEHPLETIQDYVKSFLAGEGTPVIRLDDGRFVPVSEVPEQCVVSRRETLPVVWH